MALTLTMAQLGYCPPLTIDPEDPRCARLILSGHFQFVSDAEELAFAKNALFERHPTMTKWPVDHNWKVHKIVPTEVWLINMFGGGM